MPTLFQPIGLGIAVGDYRGSKAALFDTTSPQWWVVETEDLRAASVNPSTAAAFVGKLRSNQSPASSSFGDEPPQQFYIIYKLTDKCNFSCTYCYDRNFTRAQDAEKRNRAIRDYLTRLNTDRPDTMVNVLFHGGEPLLAFGEISELLKFGSTLSGLRLSYSIQSNASLLDQAKFDFLYSHSVGLCFSVDGVQTESNRLRVNKYNPNCYELVKQKIREINGLECGSVGLLFTIGAHNVTTVCDSIRRAEFDGFRSVSFSFMHEIDRDTVPATPTQIAALYAELVDAILQDEVSSIAVWPLIDWIMKVTFGRANSICNASPCGAGRGLIAILPSGELSPCDSLFSQQFIFSDIHTYDQSRARSQPFQDLLSRRTESLLDCAVCDVRRICNGTCAGSAALTKGTVKAVDDNECAVQYSLIRNLVWLLADKRKGEQLLAYVRTHVGQRRHIALRT